VIARAVLALLPALAPARAAPDVRYELEHRPAPEAGGPTTWVVTVTVTGVRPKGGTVWLELSDRGGWRGAGFPYFELLECTPQPVAADPGRGRYEVELRSRRERAVLRYAVTPLPLHSPEQRAHGLLPAAGAAYAFGYSPGVLMQVGDEAGPLEGDRTIELRAPADTVIATGWAGGATGRQQARLDPAMEEGPIAFGAPSASFAADRDGFEVEVWQYGDGVDVADVVGETILRSAPELGRRFGLPPRDPYRAFVTDHAGGGMGSRFGLRLSATAEDGPERRTSPWFRALVLHELVHDWLGIAVSDVDERLVWFKEGFTEYFALREAAASGAVERGWFADRLLELESIARERSAVGRVAFGDPDVAWRDGDGPVETLAYAGAPLLAFRMDVELFETGHARLDDLVRDLVASGEATFELEDLRAWCRAHGLRGRWERSVEGTELPAARETLGRAGFERVDVPADLTYLGLAVEPPRLGGTITTVDAAGPAGAAGFRVGDVVTGYWPSRAEPVRPPDEPGPYPFGLTLLVPGLEGSYVGVRRGDQDLQLFVDPRILPGAGRIEGWGADGERAERFLAAGR